MNYYYIDPSYSGISNGSINSPYTNISTLISNGIEHPCTISLKCGTTLVENVLFKSTLKNTSNEQSFITSYGDGEPPVWVNSTIWASQESGYTMTGQHITSRNTRNLTISNINFVCRANNKYTPIDTSLPIETIWLRLEILNDSTESTIDANVYVKNCSFSCAIIEGSSRRRDYEAVIHIIVTSTGAKRANKFGVSDCDFYGVSRAITCTGNHSFADDLTDNSKGTYYSMGVQVENCSFVRNGRGAVLFQGIESEKQAEDTGDLQSFMRNCNYSRYRWDSMNDVDTTQSADAGFWTWRCNRILIEKIYGGGSYSLNLDAELIDFDYLTWDSVARNCVSYNNSALALIMASSSTTATGGARAAYNSSYTIDEYFNLRRNGQGNNIIKNCVSYNDGVDLGNKSIAPYTGFIKSGGGAGTYNTTIQNCLCIDTVSCYYKSLITTLPLTTTPNLVKYKLSNNIFVFPYMTVASLLPIKSASQDVSGTLLSNNTVYCGSVASADILSNLTQGSTVQNISYNYPDNLINIPRQIPQTHEDCMLLLSKLGLI